MSETVKFRKRNMRLLLYPDDATHAACIESLKVGGYQYAGILHNKDIDDKSTDSDAIKKAHWHIVIHFKNAVWNTAVAKELGIEPNYIRECVDVDGALLYLVHSNDPDKHQYDLEEVFGPMAPRLAKLLADDTESERALTIFDMIDSSPGFVSYTEIFRKACMNGLYADFRRMGSGVSYLIREHNAHYEYSVQYGDKSDLDGFSHHCGRMWARDKDVQPWPKSEY